MLAMQLVALLGLTILSCMRLLAASGLSWLAWLTVLTALFIQGRWVQHGGYGTAFINAIQLHLGPGLPTVLWQECLAGQIVYALVV